MRLVKIQKLLKEKDIEFTYNEMDDLGSIDFNYRGLPYHIWEFQDGEAGAESNVANAGKTIDYFGDYQSTLSDIMKEW